jgi:aspartyl-tRNA(Asn)/glutamyl-tRNA(Gln) amidotransferase subunit C
MSLSLDQVQWIADLARLEIAPDEQAQLAADLSAIVDYIGQLQQLDTTGVEPLAHALDLHDVFRDDEPGVSLTVEEALANAPAKNAAYYRVPAVMD